MPDFPRLDVKNDEAFQNAMVEYQVNEIMRVCQRNTILAANESKSFAEFQQEMSEDFYLRQRELMSHVVTDSDVVITTAAVPGKKAPMRRVRRF